MHPGAGQQGGGVVVAGDACQVVGIGVRYEDRAAGAHTLRGQAVGVVRGDMAGRIGGLDGFGGVGGLHREGAEERRAVVGSGAVLVQDGVEDIDRHHVGELGHGDLGQFPGGLAHLQCRADPGGAVGDQGQPLPGLGRLPGRLVPVGDIHDQVGHPQYPPVRVLQPVQRDRPGVLVARVGGGTADDRGLVDHGRPGLQDLPHRGLGHLELRGGHDLAVVPPEVVFRGYAVHPLQSGVDGHIPQFGVEHRQPDGGLGDQPGGQGDIPLHLAERRGVGGQPEGVEIAVVVRQPHIAQLHQPYGAVLVPDGESAAPAVAGLHDPGEPADHQVPVLLVDEQGRRVPPERLLGAVAVQVLGLRAPQDDPPIGVQQDRGHAEEIHQPARLWRYSLRLPGLGRTPVGCAHPGTPSTRRTAWQAPRSGPWPVHLAGCGPPLRW